MALKNDMKLWQIKEFLEEEVKEQIFLEVAPILYIGQEVGGYFGVTRQILSYFEFLGALYKGYNGRDKYPNGAKKIATPKKSISFIEDILGTIDSMYRENGKYLYTMYRNGLVHLYQPRTIKLQNDRVLKWAAYKGARERATINFKTDSGDFSIQNVRHLGISVDPSHKVSDFLTVSITCLYKDLLTAVDKYYELLEGGQSLVQLWCTTANAILTPEEHSIIGGDK